MKDRNLLSWLFILIGAMLIAAPMLFPLSVAVPPRFPYLPEGYYSKGEIGYVSPRTGKYYLFCNPISENGVPITSVKVRFVDLGIEYPMYLNYVPIDYPAYDWYSFWIEFNIASPLQYYTNYTIEFNVADAKGRTCSVTSWVKFIPIEPLPVPEGYFTINGQEAYENTTVILLSPELTITFVPTKYAEYITHITVEVYKGDTLIDLITSQEIPNTPRFYKQPDGTWQATYTLPSYGVYTLKGYVITEQRTIQLLSINLNYKSSPTGGYGIILQIAGAILIAIGAVMLLAKKK